MASRDVVTTMQFQFVVERDHLSLPGHFPGRPIVPGVLLLDQLLNAVTREFGQPVERLQQVKFGAALLPDETAIAHVEAAGRQLRFSVRVQRGGAPVTVASGSLLLADAAP
jgi:3-hydroxyacyl-[acyl-carrier-protein] dehydratase